jgi:hypothetical protein
MQNPSPNSYSFCSTWEEAMFLVHTLKYPPLVIKSYNNKDNLYSELDVEHVWDISVVKDMVFDYLLQTVGLIDYYLIEH